MCANFFRFIDYWNKSKPRKNVMQGCVFRMRYFCQQMLYMELNIALKYLTLIFAKKYCYKKFHFVPSFVVTDWTSFYVFFCIKSRHLKNKQQQIPMIFKWFFRKLFFCKIQRFNELFVLKLENNASFEMLIDVQKWYHYPLAIWKCYFYKILSSTFSLSKKFYFSWHSKDL